MTFSDAYAAEKLAEFLSTQPCPEITIQNAYIYEKWKQYLEIAKSLANDAPPYILTGDFHDNSDDQNEKLPNICVLIQDLRHCHLPSSYFKTKITNLEKFTNEYEMKMSIATAYKEIFFITDEEKYKYPIAKYNLTKLKNAFDKYGESKIQDMISNYGNVYDIILHNLNLSSFVNRVVSENPHEPCVEEYFRHFTDLTEAVVALSGFKYLAPLLKRVENEQKNVHSPNPQSVTEHDNYNNGLFLDLE